MNFPRMRTILVSAQINIQIMSSLVGFQPCIDIVKMMNNEGQEAEGIHIDESEGMDDDEREMFLNVRRSKSDDSFLGKLMTGKEPDRRQLILDLPQPSNNNLAGFRVFKKHKKQKKKNQSDYRKNICGYITKKIIREFVGPNYSADVQARCERHGVEYGVVKSHYLAKIEQVTGPSHIPKLLVPQNPTEANIKNVFCQFFEWFVKERYLRYLLLEGKMADKKAYIEYKNNFLLAMLNQSKNTPFTKHEENSSSESDSEDDEMADEKVLRQ